MTTNTVDSPIFDSTTTYTQGGVDVGTTQYEDAFQRANFWGTVKNNPNYHFLLSQTVLAEQTLSPPRSYGKTGSPFGFTAGEVDINWFDAQIARPDQQVRDSAEHLPHLPDLRRVSDAGRQLLHRRISQLGGQHEQSAVVRRSYVCGPSRRIRTGCVSAVA